MCAAAAALLLLLQLSCYRGNVYWKDPRGPVRGERTTIRCSRGDCTADGSGDTHEAAVETVRQLVDVLQDDRNAGGGGFIITEVGGCRIFGSFFKVFCV